MDTNELVAHVRARFDHESQKRLLQEKYEAKMLFAHAGGMWRAGPELLTVLSVCKDTEAVLLDLYQTPIRITVQELHILAYQRWQEQLNAWLVEWEHVRHQR
jgi:hypothetical protein